MDQRKWHVEAKPNSSKIEFSVLFIPKGFKVIVLIFVIILVARICLCFKPWVV